MVTLSYLVLYGIIHNFVLDERIYKLGTCNIQTFENASQIRDNCLKNTKDALQLVNTSEVPSNSPVGFSRKQCLLKPKIDACVDQANSIIKQCLNSTQLHGVEIWRKIDKEIYDYACKDNGKVSYTYYKRDKSCWKVKVRKAVEKCFEEHLTVSSPFYDILKLQGQCRKFYAFKSCFLDNMEEEETCPLDTASLIVPVLTAIRNGICHDITFGPDDFKFFFKNALFTNVNVFKKPSNK